jgi:hypothetical protein
MKLFLLLVLSSIFLVLDFTNCTKETNPIMIHDTVNIKSTDTVSKTDTLYRGDTTIITLTLQPGPDEGQNTIVTSNLYAALNLNFNPDIYAGTWTYAAQGGGTGIGRTFIKFIGLDGMPDSATILSAKLSLYGISSGDAAPQGNSTGIDNSAWLMRLTTDWHPDTVTWNNKPAETDVNKVAVPASTSVWNYDALDIDVTHLVDDLLNDNNYGFVLEGQTEETYRSLSFASCKVADHTKWPKLVVVYEIFKRQ